MAKQIINIGSQANDGTGDPLRTAFEKTKSNFDELYAAQTVLEVATNLDKQSLSNLPPGKLVSIEQEGGRVELYHGDSHDAPQFLYAKIGGTAYVLTRLTPLDVGNKAAYYDSTNELYFNFVTGTGWILRDEIQYDQHDSGDFTAAQCWEVDWTGNEVNTSSLGSVELLLPLHPIKMAAFGEPAEMLEVTFAEVENAKLSLDFYYPLYGNHIDIYWDGARWACWFSGDSEEFSVSTDDTEFPWLATTWSNDYRGSLEGMSAPLPVAHEPNWSDIVPTYEVTVINDGIYAGTYTLNNTEVPAYATQNVGWMKPGKHQQVKAFSDADTFLTATDGADIKWSRVSDNMGVSGSIHLPMLPKVRAISISSNQA